MEPLTLKQKSILDFIEDSLEHQKVVPTYREIQAHFGFKSLGSIYKYVQALEKKGWLKKTWGHARSLNLTKLKTITSSLTASLVGELALGEQIQTYKKILTVDLPPSLCKKEAEQLYALRVRGNDFLPLHILEGDLLFVRPQPDSIEGNLVLYDVLARGMSMHYCFSKDEVFSFKIFKESDEEILVPAQNVTLYGEVVGVLRQLVK
jgi:repressor LexA